jgi:hypothetical protein
VWGLTIEEEENLLATCAEIESIEISPEEEEELLCTCSSVDLLRSGSSNLIHNPRIRVREDLFAEEIPSLINIVPMEEDLLRSGSEEIPSLINIIPMEEDEDEVQIIEPPEIVYIKTVINMDITKE